VGCWTVLCGLRALAHGTIPQPQKIHFAIFKMRAIFQTCWVRRLIGKLGVPYNRRLRVRGFRIHVAMQLVYRPPQRKSVISDESKQKAEISFHISTF
jgi:hypothetical protein